MIPKTFQLAGRTWKVKFMDEDTAVKDYGSDHEDLSGIGLCSPRTATQYIVDREGYPRDFYEITHIHELLHGIFYTMGYELGEGPHTEQNVEAMSFLIHQYLTTKKGEIDLA